MSHVIRIDDEVKRVLDAERTSDERNYNAAIKRLIERARIRKMLVPSPDDPPGMLLTLSDSECWFPYDDDAGCPRCAAERIEGRDRSIVLHPSLGAIEGQGSAGV